MRKIPLFFTKIQKRFEAQQGARHMIFEASDQARIASKRAIFAVHREDRLGANQQLVQARVSLEKAEKLLVRQPILRQEGVYAAAKEEFVEAVLFSDYVQTGAFQKNDQLFLEPAAFIGGLSDATGEIVRYAVREAGQGRVEAVPRAREAVETAVEFLLKMDLTGPLRQKADQAKRNLHALEQMVYELRLSRGFSKPPLNSSSLYGEETS
ncbi:MAG TPA: hypothetical protein VJB99_01600 [Patescibacteria group bacterium]|nr:hypothetical protein [Patescibacteria group bacterium]